MNPFVVGFLKQFVTDRASWVAAAVYLSSQIAPHLPWHDAAPVLTEVLSAVASWAFVHITHTKLFKKEFGDGNG